ncbi:MAG: hypothetical protein ABH874_05560 [Methanobacteriota archaeon]|nr:hypothetical protein [Candidatus Hydrothermarchaeota archaeon]
MKLSKEEAEKLRQKPVLADIEHFVMRNISRVSFEKSQDAILYGDIFREGKNKYRAVLPIKKKKIIYVIFYDKGGYIEPVTVGITTRKGSWG